MLVCAGCSVKIADNSSPTAAPDFVTSTLPPTAVPQSTQTPFPPTAIPTNSPTEGTTNTQLNVRAGTSTASASLGMVGAFEKVQVIGKDASGSWYQIVYAGSASGNGWVRAEYVQVNDTGQILLVGGLADSGSEVSGLVLENINIRSGPGADFESIAVLSPKDAVLITGKDASGAWAQIQVAGVEDLKGWVTVKFLQAENLDDVPVIGGTVSETAVPIDAVSTSIPPATQDGDSMQAPLTVARFSPTDSQAVQVQGNVSAPTGDTEDWVQFTTTGNGVVIQAVCTSDTLALELWNDEKNVNSLSHGCGEGQFASVTPNGIYFLRILEISASELRSTDYILTIEDIH